MHKLYTDGTYHSHIDCAGIGGYIRQEEETIFKFSEEISEEKYYNHHEHVAVIYGLKKALEMNIHDIRVYSDMDYCSKYLNQDLNTFNPKSNNATNQELVFKIIALAKQFSSITFCHVPREKNKKAHKLANAVYSKRKVAFKVEPPHKGRKKKIQELCSLSGFPVFSEPTQSITFFTFNSYVEIKLTDLVSQEFKELRLMRYPFKKDMVDAVKELTKDFPPEEKVNFYRDQESDFLETILFG
jgi:ribonuclease HI